MNGYTTLILIATVVVSFFGLLIWSTVASISNQRSYANECEEKGGVPLVMRHGRTKICFKKEFTLD